MSLRLAASGDLTWWRQLTGLIHAAGRGDEDPDTALALLRDGLGFDASLLTVMDPSDPGHHRPVAGGGYSQSVVQHMTSEYVARCPGYAYATTAGVAARVCDTPFDFRETRTYQEHLGPSGFNEGVTLYLDIPWAGTNGMLAMSSTSRNPMTAETRLGLTILGPELATVAAGPTEDVFDDVRDGDLLSEVRPDGHIVWLSGDPSACELPVESVLDLARYVRVSRRHRAAVFRRDRAGIWWHLAGVQRHTTHHPGRVVVHLTQRSPGGGLTPREIDVLQLVAQGQTNSEIAAELVISLRTVKSHVEALLLKLGQTHRAGLVRVAVEEDLLDPLG